MKFEEGKPRMELVPFEVLEEIGKVLTFGALKYDPNSWQGVPDAVAKYTGALIRHLAAFRGGEDVDADSGLHHLSHAACDLAFILYFLKKAGKLPAMSDLDWSGVRDKYAADRLRAKLDADALKRVADNIHLLEISPSHEVERPHPMQKSKTWSDR
jgi:dATP/dGTP diphosphohydrolase